MKLIRSGSKEKSIQVLRSEEKHGGNVYRAAEELGIPENKLIDFSASINPLGISKKVKDVINRELNNLVNYPDPDTKMLRRQIAEHYDIDPGTIICGNGSTELIYLIPRALKPEKVLIPALTFSEYERACKACGQLQVISYKLKKGNNLTINPDEFIKALQGCDMAFLCNPNNPTGLLLKRVEALAIAEAARKIRCYLIVDEAFIDFVPEESVIQDIQENPYLIVLRSMTKFYALTGLRIGYGFFHKDLIERIKQFKEPWTVNNLAQKAAIASLGDDGYSKQTFEMMKKEKLFMEKSFKKMGIQFFPSAANYYLLKIPHSPPLPKGGIINGLREKGILVRDCSNFRGLEGSYLRVAVKSRSENEILLRAFSRLLTVS